MTSSATGADADAQALEVCYPTGAGAPIKLGARELASALSRMLAEPVAPVPSADLDGAVMLIGPNMPGEAAWATESELEDDSFAIARRGSALMLAGASERAVFHAAYDLLETLGARFPLLGEPQFPRIERATLEHVRALRVTPAFRRRAFASDIMTWHYESADRLRLHLAFDSRFIAWMARRGLNAFQYICHPRDERLKIDELVPLYEERGIASEYGGHVLQSLLPRDRFKSDLQYFALGADGIRDPRGNLCPSNEEALEIVCARAVSYARENPETALLHVWGADVREGAWCRCGRCADLAPQLQYMKVVNRVAAALERAGHRVPPVAYLAYHDTIEPDPGLAPLPNVWFEWAPRERCYAHAIDDPACATNPRYWESLKRYLDTFNGRGHVFEYYADAILFGGVSFATPATIARDLRAYHALGVRGISCLTFGAYSALAYPVNLETFARATRCISLEPEPTLADMVAERHPACQEEMARAYRALARASALVLDYGEVMWPWLSGARAERKRAELDLARAALGEAIAAGEHILASTEAAPPLVAAERELWRYGAEILAAIADYLEAGKAQGAERKKAGERAINQAARAIEHIRAIEPELKGTWGAYDIEWLRRTWLEELGRGLDESSAREKRAHSG